MKKIIHVGSLYIVIAALLWAVDGVLRRSLYSLSPLVIVFYEHLAGLILLLPVFWQQRTAFTQLTKKEVSNIMLIALFSGLLGTLWFTTALLKVNFIPFSVVFLLQKLQPIFVIIAAAAILKERITKKYILYAGVALAAAYFVTFPNGVINFQTGAGTITAALYALGAAAVWGTSTIFSKLALRTKPDQVVTSLRFGFTTVFALVVIIAHGQTSALTAVTLSQIGRFFVIALSTGMVALAIYYRGLARTEAKVATILELVFPVTAVLIDVFFYKSVLMPSQYLAAVILLMTNYQLSKLQSERMTIISHKVKGKGRGKQMGFPTINLEIPEDFVARDGIYATYITVNGRMYQGAMHYGPVPTFEQDKKSLEVFLLDTDDIANEDIVGKDIKVDFVQYVRPVMKFDNVQTLLSQIALDVKTIRGML